ncbi:hypothetical protein GCM10007425_21460 [Lysinibacillus alkalisoli]|uniref:ORC1/DEAH AAA+ ATPase domain-containing protein n=1 Tax=Lysinibacillus alkalisoli TaxID=1911548 RepID=A0A917G7E6_9BACI|nr:hypothetical protein GCM10007425_21460 [Lysinibacillus alkalisoli]
MNNVVLKGDVEEANYKLQQLTEYAQNPFIEALPPIFSEDDVLDRFMVTPRISEQDKQSETNIRYHVLKRVKNFIQPLPIHFEVERRLSTLIRRGYLARNPLDKSFLERIRALHHLREDEEQAHKYIDEIQHLLHAKNDQEEMLNFFVTLSNTVGIPTVLIGTSKAQQLFKGNFRQARRAASDGAIIWDRMDEHSEEWEFFLETLWELQCLKIRSPLTEDVKKTFYEECQGITSVAVNLFILAQERALFDENNEDEIITSNVLRQTAKKDMKIIQPMLNAIRNNDFAAMYKYEDIMINLDELMMNHKRNTQYEGRVKAAMQERKNTVEHKKREMIESLSVEIAALGIFDSLSMDEVIKATKKIVEGSPTNTDNNQIKTQLISNLIEMNNRKKVK